MDLKLLDSPRILPGMSTTLNADIMQTTDIVYHFGRDKVSIARRMKVTHLGRVKMSHP